MIPLMRTTWIINRRLLFQFSPWLAVYLYMIVNAQCRGEQMQMALILVLFTIVVTALVTLQGMLLPVEEFILSLPVSRSQVVRAKYLSSLLGLASGLALPLLTAWIAHLVAPAHVSAISREVLGIGGLTAISLAFGICLFLPFIYQFGPAKGFTAFSLTLVATIAGCVAWKGREACTIALLDFSSRILESRSFALAVIASVVLFGLASLAFSTWSYRHFREPRG